MLSPQVLSGWWCSSKTTTAESLSSFTVLARAHVSGDLGDQSSSAHQGISAPVRPRAKTPHP